MSKSAFKKRFFTGSVITGLGLLIFSHTAIANDLVRTSAGPASSGAGNVALLASDPLSVMSNNPAMLTSLPKSNQLGTQAVLVDSRFTSSLGENSESDKGPGVFPELAFVHPLKNSRFTLGAMVSLRSALRAEFDFTDPPGSLGVSYGPQQHMSEYIVTNGSVGVGARVNRFLTLGASLGMVHNQNRLDAPYVFQSHPTLQGLKVLVDLEADDLAATGMVGAGITLSDNLNFGLSYNLKSDFDARGRLRGNLSQLGLGIEEEFRYDAEVTTASPSFISASARWNTSRHVTLGMQIDWINWSDTFDSLPMHLTGGNNVELNNFLGSTEILDVAPLDWDDQVTWHLGVQYAWTTSTTITMGVEYSDVPVPESTFTPMTGAILNHSVGFGISRKIALGEFSLSYRLSQASDYRIGNSELAGGEYSHSALSLELHTVGFSYHF